MEFTINGKINFYSKEVVSTYLNENKSIKI